MGERNRRKRQRDDQERKRELKYSSFISVISSMHIHRIVKAKENKLVVGSQARILYSDAKVYPLSLSLSLLSEEKSALRLILFRLIFKVSNAKI